MYPHPIRASVAAAALLAGCGIGAPTFPTFGDTAYRIEGVVTSSSGAATPTIVYRDGPKMRVETVLANGAHAVIVFDQATDTAYILNSTSPAEAAAGVPTPSASVEVQPPTTAPTGAASPASTTATPPALAQGFAVRMAQGDAPQPLEASWVALGAENAESTGDCTAANENGRVWRPRQGSSGAERTACITDDGIVVRLSEGDVVLFEATRVDRGSQDAALFGVPANYRIIDPAAVSAEVGDALNPLDSVTGASPAPSASSPAPPPS